MVMMQELFAEVGWCVYCMCYVHVLHLYTVHASVLYTAIVQCVYSLCVHMQCVGKVGYLECICEGMVTLA